MYLSVKITALLIDFGKDKSENMIPNCSISHLQKKKNINDKVISMAFTLFWEQALFCTCIYTLVPSSISDLLYVTACFSPTVAAVEPLATGGSIDPLPNGDNMGHLPTEISMEPLANDNLGTLANCNFETLASDIVSSGDSIGQLFLRDNGEQALLGTETPDPDDDLLQKFLSDPNMLQDMGFTGDNSFSGDNSLPGIFTDENSLPAYLTELSTA